LLVCAISSYFMSIIIKHPVDGGLATGVMVDKREALAVTTESTDTVYLVRPTGIRTINP
jgi:hypothetical protein